MPTKTDMPDRWYSTKEICAYLGISRDTMLVWISTKNMPAHKVGRNWKFKVSEVDEWIKSVGIDVAVGMLIQRNSNSYLGIEKLITELIRIMEFNDSSVADMGKCITDIYEQYEVPIKDRKSLSEFMNR